MGYLLKEALKTLCGVNQWDYAVFWKIGSQNPTLLIWEECYHAPLSCSSVSGISGIDSSALAFEDWEACCLSGTPQPPRVGVPAEDKVSSLINKMILNNRVKVVGQGLVGRTVFTGNHLWILSESYTEEIHPPEVQNEVGEQFSAGIKTIAVIPIFTHGVVQFGSSSAIMDNMAFVNDVKNLILQVGCGFLSDNYISKGPVSNFEIPSFPNDSTFTPLSENYKQSVLPQPSEPWLNQQHSLQNQRSGFDGCQSSVNYGSLGIGGEGTLSDSFLQEYVSNVLNLSESIPSQVPFLSGISEDFMRSLLNSNVDTLCSTPNVSGLNGLDNRKEKMEIDSTDFDNFNQNNVFNNPRSSGDDLFDILGSDFKNKLFGGNNWNDDSSTQNHIYPDSNLYSTKEGNLECMFSRPGGTDHLLDAVISTSQPASVGNSSNASPSSSQGKLSGFPLSLAKLAGIGSVSFKSEKEDSQTFSQSSSLYGSQVSSWVEQGPSSGKQSSGGGSKKGDEGGKSNRKRLKPGESPRPRPKDRQMIQDRMKELREIVPNGAKLSIDALLERTIKHMLFLQSVTKHADKLKLTGESKIIDKDGGLVLRDGFEGGRTWACELGSRNMVCPIIVEDLNPPRQMLVEMLCDQRGLFLEIADIIRGLGLTILKGVMETRNNKIWTRFAVEADRDVTRMEIFLSLVNLLEQTIKSVPSSCNGMDTNTVSLHQVTSIPATGMPSSLQ